MPETGAGSEPERSRAINDTLFAWVLWALLGVTTATLAFGATFLLPLNCIGDGSTCADAGSDVWLNSTLLYWCLLLLALLGTLGGTVWAVATQHTAWLWPAFGFVGVTIGTGGYLGILLWWLTT